MPVTSEMTYVSSDAAIAFATPYSSVNRYLPSTSSDFLSGRMPYSLPRLFLSLTKNTKLLNAAEMTIAINTATYGVLVTTPSRIASA